MKWKGISAVWLSKTDLTNLNAGEGESNFIDVKKYKRNGIEYPYVSGQAMRYYLKEAIRRNLSTEEYMCVPNEKGETCGDIAKCILCDLFGFMTTIKKGTVLPAFPNGHPGGAYVRVSPLKVSPAIGLLKFEDNANIDLLTRRHRLGEGKMEGDIVNVEIGTNIYKCGISLDLAKIGTEESVDQEKRTPVVKQLIEEETKKRRAKKVLEAIRYLTDYSKQARLLTDFTPDMVLLAFQNKYSHRLQKSFELEEEGILNISRLNEIMDDIAEYSEKILFGMISGVVKNENEVKNLIKEKGIEVKTPAEVIKEAIATVEQCGGSNSE